MNPALDMTVRVAGFQPGAVNRAAEMRLDAGGKGVNVASFLAQLGVGVAATGLLGEENAQTFERHFVQYGIEDRFVRVPGSNRVGVKIVDSAREQTTDINLPGLVAPAEALERLLRELDRLAAKCAWFALSGSLPPGVDASFYAGCIRRIRAQGCQVAMDSSGAAFKAAVEAAPEVVKPNLVELSEWADRTIAGEMEALVAARALLGRGVGLAVVSMGERGALFVEGERAVVAQPPRVSVASTVAAGDALVAGVLAARLEGLSLEESARKATALAAGKLGFVGARLPGREALTLLEQQVKLREVGVG
jgi:1-phosphofructokinase